MRQDPWHTQYEGNSLGSVNVIVYKTYKRRRPEWGQFGILKRNKLPGLSRWLILAGSEGCQGKIYDFCVRIFPSSFFPTASQNLSCQSTYLTRRDIEDITNKQDRRRYSMEHLPASHF
jgi:hypothetical protein